MRPVPYPISTPAHPVLFAPREAAPAIPGYSQPAAHRPLLGLTVCDLGWTDALTHVEMVCDLHLGARTLSFLDGKTAAIASADSRYRAILANRILLPASRTLAVATRWDINGPLKVVFRPDRFVDSLLTFMQQRHVALVGKDVARLEKTRRRLSQHTPWHKFSVVRAADIGSGVAIKDCGTGLAAIMPDLVLVDAHGLSEEVRFERALSLRHNGLIVMAGAAFEARNQ